MPVAYPTSLPLPLANGYEIEPYDAVARSEADSGASRARRKNLAQPFRVTLRWLFTDAQFAAFEAWHADDIDQGATAFTLRLSNGEGLNACTCRFLMPYSFSRVTPHWMVSADVEVSDFPELTLSAYEYLLSPTPLSLTLSANSTSTSANVSTATLDSATITTTVTGGGEPYTYLWEKISGDTFTLVNGSTASSQTFRTASPLDNASYSAVYRVTVTDYFGNTDSDTVTVTQTWSIPANANFANVSLLMHCDGANASTSFADSSSNAHTLSAAGNAQVSTAIKKFRTGSLAIDGSGDYVSMASHASLEVRAGAFTIEAWFYPTNSGTMPLFAKMSASAGISYEHAFSANLSQAEFYYGVRGASQSVTRFPWPSTLATNAWYHVAIVRDGSGNWKAYINGTPTTQYQTAPLAGGLVFGAVITGTYNNAVDLGSNSIAPSVGSAPVGGWGGAGYLDEVQLTKGVAVYTGAFTPPAYPFPDN